MTPTRTTYRVRLLRHDALVRELGTYIGPVPKSALYQLATSYVAAGWQYSDTIDGNGQLTRPGDPSTRIEAVAVFPDDEEE